MHAKRRRPLSARVAITSRARSRASAPAAGRSAATPSNIAVPIASVRATLVAGTPISGRPPHKIAVPIASVGLTLVGRTVITVAA